MFDLADITIQYNTIQNRYWLSFIEKMLFILGRQYSKNSISYCCWLAGMLKLHLPDNWLNSNEEDIDQSR